MPTTEEIKQSVTNRLLWDDRVFNSGIHVEVQDSTVRLSGTVPTYTSRRAAEVDTLLVPGVAAVENDLAVTYTAELVVPTDTEVAERIKSLYEWNENLNSYDIAVLVDNGRAVLEGSVDSYWKKELAKDLAYAVTGVIDVTNEIAIVPTKKISDEVIAQSIKEAIKLRTDVQVENLDIEVANGVVMLSGTVNTRAAAYAAYDTVLYTAGVIDVIDRTVILSE